MPNYSRIKHNLTNDDVRDIAIRIVDAFVEGKMIADNIDTDDESEFAFQDIIHKKLNEVFNIVEE